MSRPGSGEASGAAGAVYRGPVIQKQGFVKRAPSGKLSAFKKWEKKWCVFALSQRNGPVLDFFEDRSDMDKGPNAGSRILLKNTKQISAAINCKIPHSFIIVTEERIGGAPDHDYEIHRGPTRQEQVREAQRRRPLPSPSSSSEDSEGNSEPNGEAPALPARLSPRDLSPSASPPRPRQKPGVPVSLISKTPAIPERIPAPRPRQAMAKSKSVDQAEPPPPPIPCTSRPTRVSASQKRRSKNEPLPLIPLSNKLLVDLQSISGRKEDDFAPVRLSNPPLDSLAQSNLEAVLRNWEDRDDSYDSGDRAAIDVAAKSKTLSAGISSKNAFAALELEDSKTKQKRRSRTLTRSKSSTSSRTVTTPSKPIHRQTSVFMPEAAPRPTARTHCNSPRIEHDFSPALSSSKGDDSNSESPLGDEDFITSEEIMARMESNRLKQNVNQIVSDPTIPSRPVDISPRIPRHIVKSSPLAVTESDVYENAQNVKKDGVVKARPTAAPRHKPTAAKPRPIELKPTAPTRAIEEILRVDDKVDDEDEYENSLGDFNIGVSSFKGTGKSTSSDKTPKISNPSKPVAKLPQTKDFSNRGTILSDKSSGNLSKQTVQTPSPTIEDKTDSSEYSNDKSKQMVESILTGNTTQTTPNLQSPTADWPLLVDVDHDHSASVNNQTAVTESPGSTSLHLRAMLTANPSLTSSFLPSDEAPPPYTPPRLLTDTKNNMGAITEDLSDTEPSNQSNSKVKQFPTTSYQPSMMALRQQEPMYDSHPAFDRKPNYNHKSEESVSKVVPRCMPVVSDKQEVVRPTSPRTPPGTPPPSSRIASRKPSKRYSQHSVKETVVRLEDCFPKMPHMTPAHSNNGQANTDEPLISYRTNQRSGLRKTFSVISSRDKDKYYRSIEDRILSSEARPRSSERMEGYNRYGSYEIPANYRQMSVDNNNLPQKAMVSPTISVPPTLRQPQTNAEAMEKNTRLSTERYPVRRKSLPQIVVPESLLNSTDTVSSSTSSSYSSTSHNQSRYYRRRTSLPTITPPFSHAAEEDSSSSSSSEERRPAPRYTRRSSFSSISPPSTQFNTLHENEVDTTPPQPAQRRNIRRGSLTNGSSPPSTSSQSIGDDGMLSVPESPSRYMGRRPSLPIINSPGSLLSISERETPSLRRASISSGSQTSQVVLTGRMRRRSSLPATLSPLLPQSGSEDLSQQNTKVSRHLPLDGGVLMMDGKIFKAPTRTPDPKVVPPQEAQTAMLSEEIAHTAGVKVSLWKRDVKHTLFVDIRDSVWVAGWNQKERPMLDRVFHVGDRVMLVNNIPFTSATKLLKFIKRADSDQRFDFIIRRIPFGKAYHIHRNLDYEDIGLQVKEDSSEVVEIKKGGMAANLGLRVNPNKAFSQGQCHWQITEFNHKALSIASPGNEAQARIKAKGKDVSFVVQPQDFVELLRKQLKSEFSWKDYVVS